ncbi:MAG: archease [Candidatus Kapabacteria bacterium]|nr:archease [Candidatus Kapabacteria bacterium]
MPHTADVIIHVEGTTIEELFKAAVFGLVAVLKPENLILNEKNYEFQKILKSENQNLLLVDFLSDILTIMHIQKGLVSDIIISNLDENLIDYKIFLQKVDFFERDVKAISYHNVNIKINNSKNFEAEIILDI